MQCSGLLKAQSHLQKISLTFALSPCVQKLIGGAQLMIQRGGEEKSEKNVLKIYEKAHDRIV